MTFFYQWFASMLAIGTVIGGTVLYAVETRGLADDAQTRVRELETRIDKRFNAVDGKLAEILDHLRPFR